MKKPFECALCLWFIATTFVASACQSVSVPEWPYVKEADEAGVAADGGGNTSSTETPVACDGALCDTTNYSACNVVDSPPGSTAARPISVLLVVAAVAFLRRRTRRKKERTL